jgi:hypothetical protein
LVVLLVILNVLDDVGVVAVGKALDLAVRVLLIAGGHLAKVHCLGDEDGTIRNTFGQPGLAVGASPDELSLVVFALGRLALLAKNLLELLLFATASNLLGTFTRHPFVLYTLSHTQKHNARIGTAIIAKHVKTLSSEIGYIMMILVIWGWHPI